MLRECFYIVTYSSVVLLYAARVQLRLLRPVSLYPVLLLLKIHVGSSAEHSAELYSLLFLIIGSLLNRSSCSIEHFLSVTLFVSVCIFSSLLFVCVYVCICMPVFVFVCYNIYCMHLFIFDDLCVTILYPLFACLKFSNDISVRHE